MKCPICERILKAETYEGIQLDFCPNDCGVWLDDKELTHVVKTQDESFDKNMIQKVLAKTQKVGIPEHEHARIVKCIKCSTEMTPTNYSFNSGIIVDHCPDDCGVWLDRGEIDALQILVEHWDATMEQKRAEFQPVLDKIRVESNERLKKMREDANPGRSSLMRSILGGFLFR